MNILFICHRIPYPPNKGEKIRAFNQIRYLAKEHSLFLAFLVDDPDDVRHVDGLREHCDGLAHARINPKLGKLASLRVLGSGMPLSVPYFYSTALQRDIDRELASKPYGAIVCYSSTSAEYVLRSKAITDSNRPRLVMDFVDVDSDKWTTYAKETGFPYSWIYSREGRLLQRYECKVAHRFDVSAFVSQKEVDLFASICPGVKAVSVPNGVDTQYFGQCRTDGFVLDGVSYPKPDRNDPSWSPVLVFMGAMDYFPNEDAVAWFAREVWPAVRQQHPRAVFKIVGSKPGSTVQALASVERGIEVTGFVPDVRPYLRGADVFVAPLRIARGVQNKVLEAMAAGLPVVSRPEATQGLPGAGNGSLRVADTATAFAEEVLDLLDHPEACAALVERADEFLKNFCWDRILRDYSDLVTRAD